MKVDVLGVPFDNTTRKDALRQLLNFLTEDHNHLLITPNPEIVMEAQEDEELMKILNEAELVVPDGIGVVLASKFEKNSIKERVPGCDLMFDLFEVMKDMEKSVYILGGAPGVAEKAKRRMGEKYRNLNIIGVHHGYFNEQEEEKIINEIKQLKPDLLMVGLGCPRQEKWIYKNKHKLPVKVSAGIGGTIDIMAGTAKRAPIIFQKMGLEWLHRLLAQPTRIRRIIKLPLFLLTVLKNKINRK
ncbi:WecB/TagA/CpsF family glycosyltransferase [Bacillus spongiae]|uniref:N-acetylglucosaminyldiphosphoundecaprenol N-acetyl-beta-D-mannosaminyltransferase n=1 Tax=Bacillus spongiae TaxID=2683610 RepID=A0ABU8HFQ3_9BACI